MNVIERGKPVGQLDRESFEAAVRKRFGVEPLDVQLGLELAQIQLQKGAIQDSFRTHIALVLSNTCNIDAQLGLAACALRVGQNELAIQAASTVVALAPADPRGYFLSGLGCLASQHHKEATEDLTDAAAFARRDNNIAIVEESERLLAELSKSAVEAD